jgi:hypothetical protein
MERMSNVADRLSDDWNLDGIEVERQATVTAVYRHDSGVRILWSAEPGHSVQLIETDGTTESWDTNGNLKSASQAVQTCVELVDNGLLTDMPPQTAAPELL